MIMLMPVVRALNSSASTAAGEVISCHAELLTVQIKRLRIGRAMNPASNESAPTARPVDKYPPPETLLLLSSAGRSAGTGRPETSVLPGRLKAPRLHYPLSLVGEHQVHPPLRQLRALSVLDDGYRVGGDHVQILWYLDDLHPLAEVQGGVACVDDGGVSITEGHPVGGRLHVGLPRRDVGQHPL